MPLLPQEIGKPTYQIGEGRSIDIENYEYFVKAIGKDKSLNGWKDYIVLE